MSHATPTGRSAADKKKIAEAFSFQSVSPYAEKDEYISKALLFDVQAITFEPGAGFDGQDRWSIRVVPHDGRGEELITMQSNEKRDQQMRGAAEYIESHGAIKNVRLKKSGKTFYLENQPAR
jgi:hypothetical protein